MARPIIVVAGPTASGKSALALRLAESFGGTVINADALQVYDALPILTARPGPDALARAPHRLYATLPPTARCSAGRWREMALTEIARAEGLPILCGGTGLYLRALLRGIVRVPAVAPERREASVALRAEMGPAAFRDLVIRLDPAAARLPAGDRQRLVRAHEVAIATGRPLSSWLAEPAEPGYAGPVLTIRLLPSRPPLNAACDARIEEMVAAGALDELADLDGLDQSLPIFGALGVRAFLEHRAGRLALADAMEAARLETRQYAKRQTTWFRNQMPENGSVESITAHTQYSESAWLEIFPKIRQFVLTHGGTSH